MSREIKKLINIFGRENSKLIETTIDFLDKNEPQWKLKRPINREAYIYDLLKKRDRYKLTKIEENVQRWIDMQGQEACWYYPDVFEAICKILEIKIPDKKLPLRKDFEEGCKRYQEELFGRR